MSSGNNGTPHPMFAHALAYHAIGWSVLPIDANKAVALRAWKKYQTIRAPQARLKEWFDRPNVCGVGVICGALSGGGNGRYLNVRDFDRATSYSAWARAHPRLAQSLPTTVTARGYHVIYAGTIDKIITFDDGELRGNGYIVLPPSRHPSGITYEWLNPLPKGPLPFIQDPRQAGLLQAYPDVSEDGGDVTEQTEHSEHTEHTEHTEQTDMQEEAISTAIAVTLPKRFGQRNQCIFQLARRLKGIPATANAAAQDLRPILIQWHQQALPTIATKAFDESWIDFLMAWENVKYADGINPLDAVLEAVKAAPLPAEAARYEQPELRQLVGICAEFQRVAGGSPFFISARTAQKLLKLETHRTAARWLYLLAADGILKIAEKGTLYKAARYFYLPASKSGTGGKP